MRSPIPWIGGKQKQRKLIIPQLLLAPHTRYVEVFGGAMNVLLNKPIVEFEVYNDHNKLLWNLFRQIRDNCGTLLHKLDEIPYSRATYVEWRDEYYRDGFANHDDLERAVRFFYTIRSAFSGTLANNNGWSFSTYGDAAITKFRSAIQDLPIVRDRLLYTRPDGSRTGVQLDSRDYQDVLAAYDSPVTLFYLDPPYILESGVYDSGKTLPQEWHEELARRLQDVRGFAAVSYHAHECLPRLYPSWRVLEYEYTMAGANTRVAHEGGRRKVPEVLIMNYDERGQHILFPQEQRKSAFHIEQMLPFEFAEDEGE